MYVLKRAIAYIGDKKYCYLLGIYVITLVKICLISPLPVFTLEGTIGLSSVRPSVCLSVRPSVCQSVCLSVR